MKPANLIRLHAAILAGLLLSLTAESQVGVGTESPDPSAALDVSSTNMGFLPPRMTLEQMTTIQGPANGLVVFCTTNDKLYIFIRDELMWKELSWGGSVDHKASFTIGSGSSCIETNVYGVYQQRTFLNGTHMVHLEAEVTETGAWSVTTDTLNGYSFSGSGVFMGTGTHMITLHGIGAPVNVQTDQFTATASNEGGTCSFSVEVSLFCDAEFNVVHTAGTVAPVDKTTSYGTINFITGTTDKCWITSNLGADHQATAVDDATEPSAGWYWQFNRKQGYKHDGTSRVPNTTWISNIYENSDWLAANDPCSIELGGGWRIPTYTEWNELYLESGWTNWNGAWNSALKMHAAGFLIDQLLLYRGFGGFYWSSSQNIYNEYANGMYLYFSSLECFIDSFNKAYAQTLRCLNDFQSLSAPVAADHEAGKTQIVWRWHPVSGATGYKWNTTDDFSTATDLGPDTTKTETGLALGTQYIHYLYAYNALGHSPATTLDESTLPWACGDSITVHHLVGTVAPVNKTVTYGTVTNIPGEPTKCWITQNLGADRQALAVDDNTELSAGWYWQFNRSQGYMHDGTTRTPNTWDMSYEDLNWVFCTDPCTIELGAGWRVPTFSEWGNIDAAGGWTNWNGPWDSDLKLHAAGVLYYANGSLLQRGSYGYYWSSSQSGIIYAQYYRINSGGAFVGNNLEKLHGFTLRCLITE